MLSRRALLSALAAAPLGAGLAGCASVESGARAQGWPILPVPGLPRAPRTPALPSAGPLRSLAVCSCSDEERPLPLFDTIRANGPDALAMLGDNVYGSNQPEDPDLPDLRTAYELLAANQGFRDLVRTVPTVSVWDDHDFGLNDGGADFEHKRLAQRLFATFWNAPRSSPLWQRPGVYQSFLVGPASARVQIILLDTRFFRSPLRPSERPMEPGWERYMPYPPGADVTLLGDDQWAWLAAELRKPADIRLICSSIQVIAEGHGWERWGNMPDEQARLYRLLADTGARGVVILSGDRHHGSIHRIGIPSQPDLLELTASGVNTPSSHVRADGISPRETSATRIGPGYAPIHFGRVRLDWTARTLSLQLLGDRGQEIQSVIVPFARLGLG